MIAKDLTALKKCKTCSVELNEDNSFVYEVRNGKKLLRNSCKKCFVKERKLRFKPVEFKVCSKCKINKKAQEYGKDMSKKDNLSDSCRACRKYINYQNQIMRKHGIAWNEYLLLVEMQQGRCATCNFSGKLVLDHSHKTNKVRGLLCDKCNLALGLVADNVKTLTNMAEYLRRRL